MEELGADVEKLDRAAEFINQNRRLQAFRHEDSDGHDLDTNADQHAQTEQNGVIVELNSGPFQLSMSHGREHQQACER